MIKTYCSDYLVVNHKGDIDLYIHDIIRFQVNNEQTNDKHGPVIGVHCYKRNPLSAMVTIWHHIIVSFTVIRHRKGSMEFGYPWVIIIIIIITITCDWTNTSGFECSNPKFAFEHRKFLHLLFPML